MTLLRTDWPNWVPAVVTSTWTAVVPAETPLNVMSTALNDSVVPEPSKRFTKKVPVATSESFAVTDPNVPVVVDT